MHEEVAQQLRRTACLPLPSQSPARAPPRPPERDRRDPSGQFAAMAEHRSPGTQHRRWIQTAYAGSRAGSPRTGSSLPIAADRACPEDEELRSRDTPPSAETAARETTIAPVRTKAECPLCVLAEPAEAESTVSLPSARTPRAQPDPEC